jgi:hypothetical protein
MRSAFIVIESLRNAYDLLVLHSSAWLGRGLRLEDGDGFDWAACWHMLDIEPQWVDQMCDLQMRWASGCLKVAKRYEGGRRSEEPRRDGAHERVELSALQRLPLDLSGLVVPHIARRGRARPPRLSG